ncbi:alpha/beta-Hydrolases superfamily protein [Euphorbia peplus]|nr:alpha/beta-Hydrolases superfamily protein [Euphorbia peplus]
MSTPIVESTTVDSADGVKLKTRIFKPKEEDEIKDKLVILLVHPYSILGGCQALLRGIALSMAEKGYRAVTFDMRGAGRSSGRASLTGFAEVKDVIAVCKWVCDNLAAHRILLVGSSAGAPIAGSAVDEIKEVVGYVSLGYPFGLTASILFGRHHKAILKSPKPKLFIMGTRDGFTSVKQLQNKLSSAAGRVETHLIEGAGHFQMEGPAYDAKMANLCRMFLTVVYANVPSL